MKFGFDRSSLVQGVYYLFKMYGNHLFLGFLFWNPHKKSKIKQSNESRHFWIGMASFRHYSGDTVRTERTVNIFCSEIHSHYCTASLVRISVRVTPTSSTSVFVVTLNNYQKKLKGARQYNRVPTRTGKPGKMATHFWVRGKSGNFEQTGKVRKNHTKYWKTQGISDECYLLCFNDV